MSVNGKECKSPPKYIRGIVVFEKRQLVLETNQDGLLKAMQILLGRLGFKVNNASISPCG